MAEGRHAQSRVATAVPIKGTDHRVRLCLAGTRVGRRARMAIIGIVPTTASLLLDWQ